MPLVIKNNPIKRKKAVDAIDCLLTYIDVTFPVYRCYFSTVVRM